MEVVAQSLLIDSGEGQVLGSSTGNDSSLTNLIGTNPPTAANGNTGVTNGAAVFFIIVVVLLVIAGGLYAFLAGRRRNSAA